MSDLSVTENSTHNPYTLERVLSLSNRVIALAYIDTQAIEATLGWPLDRTRSSLREIVDRWGSSFLSSYGLPRFTRNATLEFWMADNFYSTQLTKPWHPDVVLNVISARRISPRDQLNLVLLNIQNHVLELSFDSHEQPYQCAIVEKEVRVPAMVDFFSEFHAHDGVSWDRQIALNAFANAASIATEPIDYLSPLPVYM